MYSNPKQNTLVKKNTNIWLFSGMGFCCPGANTCSIYRSLSAPTPIVIDGHTSPGAHNTFQIADLGF